MRINLPLTFIVLIIYTTGFAQQIGYGPAWKHIGFIENKGQIRDQFNKPNSAVKFILALSAGMNVQLRKNGFSYDTYTVENSRTGNQQLQKGKLQKFKPSPAIYKFHRVDVNLIGANPASEIIPENPVSTHLTYLNMDRQAKAMVHSYQRVTYRNIYPLIDLVFESGTDDSARLEYNFIVRPGGNPNQIQLQYNGASQTQLVNRRIVINVTKGTFQEHIPESYTDSFFRAGRKNSLRKHVDARYHQLGSGKYGFVVGKFDRSQTLVIDPTPDLIWGTYVGGTLNDWGYCITKDVTGNIFFGGASNSPELKATSGAYQSVLHGFGDVIVGKFSDQGKLLWLTYYGGDSEDEASAIAVDQNNDVIVTGSTWSFENIATPGAYKTTKVSPMGLSDAFLVKFTNDGNLLWSTYYGGEDATGFDGAVVDINNDIYVVGTTMSSTGISTPGAFQTTHGGGASIDAQDGCIAKFNSNGAIIWSTYYGGNKNEGLAGITIDKMQNIYVIGATATTVNMTTPGTYQPNYAGGTSDGLIAKFNSNGQRQWATYFGGENADLGFDICLDSKNNIAICGVTSSKTGMATVGALQTAYSGITHEGFIMKFNAAGNRSWGTYYGANGEEYLWTIVADDNDDLMVGGSTAAANMGTPGSYQPVGTAIGGASAFLSLFHADGSLQWCTYYGRNGAFGFGDVREIVISGEYVYVVGETAYPENVASCDAYQKIWGGNQDAFIAKFGITPDASIPSVTISSDANGTVCKNKLVSFAASAKNTGLDYSFHWFWNGNPVGSNTSTYTNDQLMENDSIRCLLQKNSACATDEYNSNSIIVHIDPAIQPSINISSLTNNICQGESLTFTAAVDNAGVDPLYQWKINGIPNGTNNASFTTTTLINGDRVTCSVTHHGSCTIDSVGSSNELVINVKSILVPSIAITASANPICSGTPVTFQAMSDNAGLGSSLQWKLNGQPVGTSSNSYVNEKLEDNDQILCSLSTTIPGCAVQVYQSNTLVETVNATPDLHIDGDTIISKGYSTTLHAVASGNLISYTWSPSITLNDPRAADPIATPVETTKYTLFVEDLNGCNTEKEITVVVLTGITIPNAFSPNGDGRNEMFRALYGADASEVNFSIYNRWGQLIFQDKGNHKGWDGTFAGRQQPAGTYVWSFKYKTATNELKKIKGTVVLIR